MIKTYPRFQYVDRGDCVMLFENGDPLDTIVRAYTNLDAMLEGEAELKQKLNRIDAHKAFDLYASFTSLHNAISDFKEAWENPLMPAIDEEEVNVSDLKEVLPKLRDLCDYIESIIKGSGCDDCK